MMAGNLGNHTATQVSRGMIQLAHELQRQGVNVRLSTGIPVNNIELDGKIRAANDMIKADGHINVINNTASFVTNGKPNGYLYKNWYQPNGSGMRRLATNFVAATSN
jgi:hypothetical protein